MAAELHDYQYNGVRVRASRRRSSDRDNKAWARTVKRGDSERVVHYADPDMPMRRNNPEARANFLARHNCDSKKDPFAPGFWACYDWENTNEEGTMDVTQEAEWSTAFVNDLPDASFALILPGGEKDDDGKTTPRDLRKLPYKDGAGEVDIPHLRNALARISQVEGASAEAIAAAQAKLDAAAEEYLEQEAATPEPESEEMAAPNPTSAESADVAGAIEHLRAALEALQMGMGGDMDSNMDKPMEAAETLAEVAALSLVEAEAPTNRRAPLRMDVGIIKVGPGNQRDRHYYSREMLERDGVVFKGAKMYATDHRDDERSVRTEVSMLESIEGVREFADGQYLVGRAVVFNPDFAEDVRNRADAGVLDSLHCSILAQGEAKPGKIGEDEYNIVQRITEAKSVDWVTRAGAGGHALQLAESAAAPEPEPAPEPLDEAAAQPVTISENEGEEAIQSLPLAEVVRTLGKTNLPAASVAALSETEYEDVAAVNAAVDAEIKRLKAAGSGQPLGIQAAKQRPSRSMAEIQAEIQAVNHKWLGR